MLNGTTGKNQEISAPLVHIPIMFILKAVIFGNCIDFFFTFAGTALKSFTFFSLPSYYTHSASGQNTFCKSRICLIYQAALALTPQR